MAPISAALVLPIKLRVGHRIRIGHYCVRLSLSEVLEAAAAEMVHRAGQELSLGASKLVGLFAQGPD